MAASPQYALNQMLMNSPQLQAAIELIKQGGQSPEATFYALAQQYGVNPEEVLNMLK